MIPSNSFDSTPKLIQTASLVYCLHNHMCCWFSRTWNFKYLQRFFAINLAYNISLNGELLLEHWSLRVLQIILSNPFVST